MQVQRAARMGTACTQSRTALLTDVTQVATAAHVKSAHTGYRAMQKALCEIGESDTIRP